MGATDETSFTLAPLLTVVQEQVNETVSGKILVAIDDVQTALPLREYDVRSIDQMHRVVGRYNSDW